jgi:hypothetical protein
VLLKTEIGSDELDGEVLFSNRSSDNGGGDHRFTAFNALSLNNNN